MTATALTNLHCFVAELPSSGSLCQSSSRLKGAPGFCRSGSLALQQSHPAAKHARVSFHQRVLIAYTDLMLTTMHLETECQLPQALCTCVLTLYICAAGLSEHELRRLQVCSFAKLSAKMYN